MTIDRDKEVAAIINEVDSTSIFESQADFPVITECSKRGYVKWGDDNLLPYTLIDKIENSVVMCPNMEFNASTCYGRGISITDDTGDCQLDEDIALFFKRNNPSRLLEKSITDIKYFKFSVNVLIFDRLGERIVKMVHKEASHIRFESCNPTTGVIEHVLYADWRETDQSQDPEYIELLDENDPWGDLLIRLGHVLNDKGTMQSRTSIRKFAIVTKMYSPNRKYYPYVAWMSSIKSGWYDVSSIIPQIKKAHMKKGLKIHYQVEIHKDFWRDLFRDEGITELEKQKERKNQEYANIRNFLSGLEKGDKVLFSGFYIGPDKVEQRSVRVVVIDTKKEGGEWIADSEEASNVLCYSQGVHPSLIGATPGKSSGSMSGTDKRELFTMKQSQEKPTRDLLIEPFELLSYINKWNLEFDIPDLMLTTLDQGTDATEVSQNTNSNTNNNDTK